MKRPLRKQIPLRKRKIIKQSIKGVAFVTAIWGFFSIIVFGLLSDPEYLPEPLSMHRNALIAGWIGIYLVLLLWKTAYPILYFITYFYDMDERNIIIRKGVLQKREITLPFSRITDVNVDQDIWDVILGLYDLYISTPTEDSGRFAHIDGVDRRGAARLKELILQKIHEKEQGDDD